MGKSASSPDPTATAAAQTQTNLETARTQSRLGNPNVTDASGTVKYTWNPDDTVEKTTTLSPGQQKLYDAVQGSEISSTQRMGPAPSTGIDTSGLNPYQNGPSTGGMVMSVDGAGQGIQHDIGPTGEIRSDYQTGQPLSRMSDQDYGAQRKSVEDAIMSRVQPQYDKQRATLDANLAAQGFNVNTAGYRNAADESNRNLTDARMQAVLAGGQEQSRLAGLDQSRLGFNNAASQAETTQYNNALAAMNTAQQQGFGQAQDRGNFANAAQKEAYNQAIQGAGFTNTAQQQQYNQQAQNVDRNNSLRQQQLAETLQLRSQPINEVSSLFGLGNQITVPTAQAYQGSAIQPANYAQLVSNKYAADSANATSTNNATAAAVGTAVTAAAAI